MSNQSLFRNEALKHQSQSLYGDVILSRSHLSWLMVVLCFFILISIGLFFLFAGYSERLTVIGEVTSNAGVYRVSTERPSVVQDIQVEIGEVVKEGNILFSFRDKTIYSKEKNKQIHNNQKVYSPVSGLVEAVLMERGQSFDKDETVMLLRPLDSQLEVKLYVPSDSVQDLKLGAEALIRVSAFHSQVSAQKKGVVKTISKNMIQSIPATKDKEFRLSDSYYVVRVSLDDNVIIVNNNTIPLQVGMSLEAKLLLGYKKIYQWILGPILQ